MAFNNLGEIKHVAALLIWLDEIGLSTVTHNEAINLCKRNVEKLVKTGNLEPVNRNEPFDFRNQASNGLEFRNRKSEKFIKFCEYCEQAQDEAQIESYPNKARELLALTMTDADSYYRHLVLSNSPDSIYYEIPILAYLAVDDFVSVFLDATPNSRKIMSFVFKKRYSSPIDFTEKLELEIEWLESVINKLKTKAIEHEGKISGYSINYFIDEYFELGLNQLKKLISEKNNS